MYPYLDTYPQNDGNDEFPAAWIGLTAYRQGEDTIYEWSDQTHMTVTYWAANQPNQRNIGNLIIC